MGSRLTATVPLTTACCSAYFGLWLARECLSQWFSEREAVMLVRACFICPWNRCWPAAGGPFGSTAADKERPAASDL